MYIYLLDVHSMYCACEMIFRSDLRGKPVAVASNGDGIIVAANTQARQLGVKKYASVREQMHFFTSGQCALFSSNYTTYQAVSDRFQACIREQELFTQVATYSIDESFCIAPPCLKTHDELFNLGRQIRRAVWKHTKLPIGVGAGRTFTLAKIGSFIGKRVPGYRGICIVHGDESEYLRSVPVADIWNVGRATANLLTRKGIKTAYELANVLPQDARSWCGINLERTVRELCGQQVYNMNSFPDPTNRKEVSSSLSLTIRAESDTELHEALSQRIAVAAEKLRSLQMTTRNMVLSAQTSPYEPNPMSFRTHVFFEYPTDDTRILIASLTEHFKSLYRPGMRYYRISCRLLGLESSLHQQTDLFAPPVASKLMDTIDQLNRKFGYHAVTLGSLAVHSEAGMLRKHLSPNYLTCWRDLPRLRCG